MPEIAFELGTEELPAGACESALEQLRTAVEQRLRELRLEASSVRAMGTPRRLIVLAEGVPQRQPDQPREVRGPAKSVAYGPDGQPTGAGIGFARKQGVAVESLEILTTPQGEYVVARGVEQGRPAVEALGPALAEAVRGLFFPKMMRWGEGGLRFARPVRWILALLDEEVIPLEIAGVNSGRKSRGHRFLAPEEFEVGAAADFPGRLREAFVMADPAERRAVIREQANRLADEAGVSIPGVSIPGVSIPGGSILWDEALLDENTWLVEWPTALRGSFDASYLELPRPVLVTAMKKHQRFFPMEDREGRLLPGFIAVRNGGDRALDVVTEGNERVLSARFNDARFFYHQDRETPLEIMAERLGRILFQEKLGTLAERRMRLEMLALGIAEASGWPSEEVDLAVRAARLAKADLASAMVTELPALQGVIGREYALAGGENARVADAIAEQYQPRGTGDSLPASALGRLLALSDRMDTLAGYLGIGILPSGSSDPYGLRRAAHGVIQILADQPDLPSLLDLETLAARGYREVNRLEFDLDALCNDLGALFEQRLSAYLQDRGVRYDLVEAAVSGGAAATTLVYAVVRRADALQALAADDGFVTMVNAAGRVANILKSAGRAADHPPVPGKEGIHGGGIRSVERAVSVLESESRNVDHAQLKGPAELALFDAAHRLVPEVARRATDYDFVALYQALSPLRQQVDRFFDDVMVMAEDPAMRANRLALLCFVDALYKTLADFTRVVIA